MKFALDRLPLSAEPLYPNGDTSLVYNGNAWKAPYMLDRIVFSVPMHRVPHVSAARSFLSEAIRTMKDTDSGWILVPYRVRTGYAEVGIVHLFSREEDSLLPKADPDAILNAIVEDDVAHGVHDT